MLLDQLRKIRGGLLNVLGPFDVFPKIFYRWRVQVPSKYKEHHAKDLGG